MKSKENLVILESDESQKLSTLDWLLVSRRTRQILSNERRAKELKRRAERLGRIERFARERASSIKENNRQREVFELNEKYRKAGINITFV